MGVMLEKSKVAEELLNSMTQAFGRLPAGMGVAVILVGALMAASTGIVGATVVYYGAVVITGHAQSRVQQKLCDRGNCGDRNFRPNRATFNSTGAIRGRTF